MKLNVLSDNKLNLTSILILLKFYVPFKPVFIVQQKSRLVARIDVSHFYSRLLVIFCGVIESQLPNAFVTVEDFLTFGCLKLECWHCCLLFLLFSQAGVFVIKEISQLGLSFGLQHYPFGIFRYTLECFEPCRISICIQFLYHILNFHI